MSVVAVIPARSGSKGFPGKNLAAIEGRSLLALAVRLGVDCDCIDDVYVSTDSPDYEKEAVAEGALSVGLRPSSLATDTTRTADVVAHLMARLPRDYEIVVLLQPTSPARRPLDVEACVGMLAEHHDVDAVISVSRLDEPHPHKLKVVDGRGRLMPFLSESEPGTPRQLLPPVYQTNGAVYAIRAATLMAEKTFHPANTLPYFMDSAVNIDSETDFILLEALYRRGKIHIHGL